MELQSALPELVQDLDHALRQTLTDMRDGTFECTPDDVENILKMFKASLLLWQGQLELLQMPDVRESRWMEDQVVEVSNRLQPAISILQHKLDDMPDNVVSFEVARQRRG